MGKKLSDELSCMWTGLVFHVLYCPFPEIGVFVTYDHKIEDNCHGKVVCATEMSPHFEGKQLFHFHTCLALLKVRVTPAGVNYFH